MVGYAQMSPISLLANCPDGSYSTIPSKAMSYIWFMFKVTSYKCLVASMKKKDTRGYIRLGGMGNLNA